MRLYIAEKPSLGRAIAEVLPGTKEKGEGYIRLANGDVVSWCIGHLLEQVPPEGYDPQFKRWQWQTLPIVPRQWQLQPRSSSKSQLAVLRRWLREADELVHAGDPDREGQLLVDEVIDYLWPAQRKRPPVWRCLINDLNPPAVRRALEQLKPNADFAMLSQSALARSRADWLYGINLTRAYTLLARDSGSDRLLSVGRVQTPVLGLVVRRDKEIAQFIRRDYFEVEAEIRGDAVAFRAKWQPSEACLPWQDEEGRVVSRALADKVVERITNQPALVSKASQKQGSQSAPLPYNLSALQIDASRQLSLSAQQTLDICQELYERHKLITYPRSDCRHLPQGQFADRHAVLQSVARLLPDMAPVVVAADLELKSAAWNDHKVTAHHAIIPTANRRTELSLSPQAAAIYQLIARQYLAQFYAPLRYRDTELRLTIAGGCFIARGREILHAGWRGLYPTRTRAADDAIELPFLSEGTLLHCLAGERLDKQTEPPKPFTEATLLAAMTGIARYVLAPELKAILRDTDGLGTEATRAGMIELLIARGFLLRAGKALRSSETGQALIAALPEALGQADMTARWERELAAIEHGEQQYSSFMSPLENEIAQLIGVAQLGRAQLRPILAGLPAGNQKRGKGRRTVPVRKPRHTTKGNAGRSRRAQRVQEDHGIG